MESIVRRASHISYLIVTQITVLLVILFIRHPLDIIGETLLSICF